MTFATPIDLDMHRAKREREYWLQELASIQKFSVERMHGRDLDWNRLGDAANEAAELIAMVDSASYEAAAA